MPIPMLGVMGGLTPEQRRAQMAARMGMAPPGVAAAAQQMGNAMNQLGPAPPVFQMPGGPAPPPAAGLAAAAAGLPGQAPPMMAPPPAPDVAGPPPGPPPALADQIRQQYLAQMQAPMQQAGVPMSKAGSLVNAMAGAGLGATAAGPAGLVGGAGLGLLAQHLKDRRGRRNLGTAQFAKGGPVRMAAGGAAKVRKDFPNTGPMPKKGKGMGAAVRGHNFKGSV